MPFTSGNSHQGDGHSKSFHLSPSLHKPFPRILPTLLCSLTPVLFHSISPCYRWSSSHNFNLTSLIVLSNTQLAYFPHAKSTSKYYGSPTLPHPLIIPFPFPAISISNLIHHFLSFFIQLSYHMLFLNSSLP